MKPKRLLVIRFSALGDVAMTIPVLKSLLNQNPEVELYFLGNHSHASLFESIPEITFIPAKLKEEHRGVYGLFRLYQSLRKYRFDAIADLHSVLRTRILRFFIFFQGQVKIKAIDKGRKEKTKLTRKENKIFSSLPHNTERYAEVFRKLNFSIYLSHELQNSLNLTSIKSENAIGVAPFAKHKQKEWFPNRMREVVNTLAENGRKVYLFGGKEDREELERWQTHQNIESVAGKYSFQEELRIIKDLDAMIAMDSANMHLASLVGTRVFSIWGGTHPDLGFLGYGQSIKDVIHSRTPSCRPCSVFGNKTCWRGDWACLDSIQVNQVLDKIQKTFPAYNE